MVYGYARISKPTQNIERQIRNIKEFDSNAQIFNEAYSGRTSERPEWKKLLKKLKKGDLIIFDSVSRMSRNSKEGFQEYENLYNRGVDLIFLKERHIDTEIYRRAINQEVKKTGNQIVDIFVESINTVLMTLVKEQIKLAFQQSEKEVEDLRIRTSEGMKTAKLNGKKIGRQKGDIVITKKSKHAKPLILKHSIDFGGTLTDTDIIKLIGISRNTYYKYKKELKEDN